MMKTKGFFPIDRFAQIRTPFYYYDTELLEETLKTVKAEIADHPDFHVHYAVKANFNPEILKIIARAGLGADCVSGGEVEAALQAGFPANSIVFAGVGKSDEEIQLGLDADIFRFNVESLPELEVINELAGASGKIARISLRVNPDIEAHTHANIMTGLAENKFGINHEQLPDMIRKALSMSHIRFNGLHFHIGSQILDMEDFIALCNRIDWILDKLEAMGLPIGDLNVGGGLGIDYEHPNRFPMADFGKYFNIFKTHLCLRPGQQLHFELGRSLVAQCGSLIAKVLYVKQGMYKDFVIIDGSMTELVRPAMYGSFHKIENISAQAREAHGIPYVEHEYDVVGPVCESSDVFVKGFKMQESHRGDLLALRSAGAYGESMASGYNCRHLPRAIFSCDNAGSGK